MQSLARRCPLRAPVTVSSVLKPAPRTNKHARAHGRMQARTHTHTHMHTQTHRDRDSSDTQEQCVHIQSICHSTRCRELRLASANEYMSYKACTHYHVIRHEYVSLLCLHVLRLPVTSVSTATEPARRPTRPLSSKPVSAPPGF